jgi:hypothetical protein
MTEMQAKINLDMLDKVTNQMANQLSTVIQAIQRPTVVPQKPAETAKHAQKEQSEPEGEEITDDKYQQMLEDAKQKMQKTADEGGDFKHAMYNQIHVRSDWKKMKSEEPDKWEAMKLQLQKFAKQLGG